MSAPNKHEDAISATQHVALGADDDVPETKEEILESHEVFQKVSEGVDFRTVSWQRATVIFIKIQFAMSILAVPGALGALGAVGGALSIVGWQTLNTYTSVILGDFRKCLYELCIGPQVLEWSAELSLLFVCPRGYNLSFVYPKPGTNCVSFRKSPPGMSHTRRHDGHAPRSYRT